MKPRLFFATCLLLCVTSVAQARVMETRWQPRKPLHGEIRAMPMAQLKGVLKHVVAEAMKEGVFKEELPQKVVLSRVEYSGPFRYDTKYLTDLLVNFLISDPAIVLMNQDMQIETKTNFHLVEYLNKQKTREKAVLLGADYVFSSMIRERIETRENNEKVRVVETRLQLNELSLEKNP